MVMNGKEVLKKDLSRGRSNWMDQMVLINFKRGENILVFKVLQKSPKKDDLSFLIDDITVRNLRELIIM